MWVDLFPAGKDFPPPPLPVDITPRTPKRSLTPALIEFQHFHIRLVITAAVNYCTIMSHLFLIYVIGCYFHTVTQSIRQNPLDTAFPYIASPYTGKLKLPTCCGLVSDTAKYIDRSR